MFVLPIGGGDMPVVISILNSLTGLAAALTGFVLHNQMLGRKSPQRGMIPRVRSTGCPSLDVDRARNIIVLKRSMGHGFAGIDNALFYHEKTRMLFGDARQSLTEVGQALKSA